MASKSHTLKSSQNQLEALPDNGIFNPASSVRSLVKEEIARHNQAQQKVVGGSPSLLRRNVTLSSSDLARKGSRESLLGSNNDLAHKEVPTTSADFHSVKKEWLSKEVMPSRDPSLKGVELSRRRSQDLVSDVQRLNRTKSGSKDSLAFVSAKLRNETEPRGRVVGSKDSLAASQEQASKSGDSVRNAKDQPAVKDALSKPKEWQSRESLHTMVMSKASESPKKNVASASNRNASATGPASASSIGVEASQAKLKDGSAADELSDISKWKKAVSAQRDYEDAVEAAVRTLEAELRNEQKRRHEQDFKWAQRSDAMEKRQMDSIIAGRAKVDQMFAQRRKEVLNSVKANFELKIKNAKRLFGLRASLSTSDLNQEHESLYSEWKASVDRVDELLNRASAQNVLAPSTSGALSPSEGLSTSILSVSHPSESEPVSTRKDSVLVTDVTPTEGSKDLLMTQTMSGDLTKSTSWNYSEDGYATPALQNIAAAVQELSFESAREELAIEITINRVESIKQQQVAPVTGPLDYPSPTEPAMSDSPQREVASLGQDSEVPLVVPGDAVQPNTAAQSDTASEPQAKQSVARSSAATAESGNSPSQVAESSETSQRDSALSTQSTTAKSSPIGLFSDSKPRLDSISSGIELVSVPQQQRPKSRQNSEIYCRRQSSETQHARDSRQNSETHQVRDSRQSSETQSHRGSRQNSETQYHRESRHSNHHHGHYHEAGHQSDSNPASPTRLSIPDKIEPGPTERGEDAADSGTSPKKSLMSLMGRPPKFRKSSTYSMSASDGPSATASPQLRRSYSGLSDEPGSLMDMVRNRGSYLKVSPDSPVASHAQYGSATSGQSKPLLLRSTSPSVGRMRTECDTGSSILGEGESTTDSLVEQRLYLSEPHSRRDSVTTTATTGTTANGITSEDEAKLRAIIVSELVSLMEENSLMEASQLIPKLCSSKESTLKKIMRMIGKKSSKVRDVKSSSGYVGPPGSGAPTPVFGAALEHLASGNEYAGIHSVPTIVVKCVMALEKNGIRSNGIFRVAGNQQNAKELRRRIDSGEEIDFDKIPPNDISIVFKAFLRELREPLLTYKLYPVFISVANTSEASLKVKALRLLICLLPTVHRTTLQFLLGFLAEVAALSDLNSMTSSNLAIVFGPNILQAPPSNKKLDVDAIAHTNAAADVVDCMIQYHQELWQIPDYLIERANEAKKHSHSKNRAQPRPSLSPRTG